MSFLCKFQKQPALAEEAPVVSTTLSIPFSAIHAWHRAPMRDAGKFKMQLVSMGRYFKKWGCGKGTF